jgi:multidrug efflux system outer membrane protein
MIFNKTNILKVSSIVLISILLYSCKAVKINESSTRQELPETFNNTVSKESVGDLTIRDFFKDPVLQNLIDSALQHNRDIKITNQRIIYANAGYMVSKRAILPSLNYNADAGVTRFGDYTLDGVGNFDTNLSPNISEKQRIPTPTPNYFIGLTASWELDIWGRLRNRKKAAYNRLLASEYGKQFVVTSVVSNVASQYYNLIALDKQLSIIRSNIEIQEQALSISILLKEGGRVNELAVQQMRSLLNNTKSLEFEVKQQIVETENQLKILTGKFSTPITRDTAIAENFFPDTIMAGVPVEMLFRRPDIKEAESNLNATEAEINAARAHFFPSLTIGGAYGLNSFSFSTLTNPASLAYNLLAGITGPVFNNRVNKANMRIAQASNKEALYNYEKSLLAGYFEVTNYLKRIENFDQIINYKRLEVDALHNAVNTSNSLFRTGYASYFEVLMAQKNVLNAEIDMVKAENEKFISLILLYKSLGGGLVY